MTVLVVVSCNSGKKQSETPEAASSTFIKAFYTCDYDALYQCTVKSNRPLIQQMQKQMNDNKEKFEQAKHNEVEIQNITCVMQNDSLAECVCQFLFNKNPRKMTYDLRHEDEKWVVDLSMKY